MTPLDSRTMLGQRSRTLKTISLLNRYSRGEELSDDKVEKVLTERRQRMAFRRDDE